MTQRNRREQRSGKAEFVFIRHIPLAVYCVIRRVRPTNSKLCDGGGQRKFLLYTSQRLDRATQVLSPATSLSRARSLGRSQARYSVAPLLTLRPKIGSRKIPDFSLFISQNLLKSRVFVIYIMGLFFSASRVEQAHFSPLTTCLTTCGNLFAFVT